MFIFAWRYLVCTLPEK